MKLTAKYTENSNTITLYFPSEFDSAQLADLCITTEKIVPRSITYDQITQDPTKNIITENLRDALITTAKIVNLAVDNAKLANLTVEAGKLKLATPFLTGDTWSANTPNAGYISWTAHTLVYDGVAYSILAGNTNKTYVSFDGTTTYATSNTLPVLTNSQFNIATNNAGTPDLAWMGVCRIPTAIIGTAAIADLAVASAKIGELAVIESKIADLAVGTAKIAALAVTDAKIASLNASKITIESLGIENQINNGDFESWTAGTSVAPDSWVLTGAGAAVTRATGNWVGTYNAQIIRGGTDCYLYQNIYAERGIAYWKGRTVTVSCWVWASVANRALIGITDNINASYSSYHTGSSEWELLTVTHTINASAEGLAPLLRINTGDTTAYFDGAMLVEGELALPYADRTLGNKAGYHAVLEATGLNIYDGTTLLAKYGATTLIGKEAASKNNVLIDADGLYLRVNTTSYFSVSKDGVSSLNLLPGSEIKLAGSATPAKLTWDGSSYDISIYASETGGVLNILPATTYVTDLYIGDSSNAFKNISSYADYIYMESNQSGYDRHAYLSLNSTTTLGSFILQAYYDSDDYAFILADGGNNTSEITFTVDRNGTSHSITFTELYTHLHP